MAVGYVRKIENKSRRQSSSRHFRRQATMNSAMKTEPEFIEDGEFSSRAVLIAFQRRKDYGLTW